MLPFAILCPVFAMVLLIFVVWSTMFVQRARHMRTLPPSASDFADGDSAMRYFRPVEMPANNLANLFEMPVLFFALIPLLLITQQASHAQVGLAWAYVLLRAAHSFVHIGPKQVRPRFLFYLASCAVLAAMWTGFAVDIGHAHHVYSEAMRAYA